MRLCTKALLHPFIASARSVLIVATLAVVAPTLAAAQAHDHGTADAGSSSKLVQIVRDVTRKYVDVNVATSDGYIPLFGCVSGPDHGAMGIHYINPGLVGDGLINVNYPEAIIYEPTKSGLKLVGVEYIVDSKTWLDNNPAPPMLEDQAFQIVGSPNRYGLAAFFELHVWAWRDNPNGAFVDWNNKVSCEHQ